MKVPLPSNVRIAMKSLAHSKEKVAIGVFNPSGKGSRSYHEKNIAHLENYLIKWEYLAEFRKLANSDRYEKLKI